MIRKAKLFYFNCNRCKIVHHTRIGVHQNAFSLSTELAQLLAFCLRDNVFDCLRIWFFCIKFS